MCNINTVLNYKIRRFGRSANETTISVKKNLAGFVLGKVHTKEFSIY